MILMRRLVLPLTAAVVALLFIFSHSLSSEWLPYARDELIAAFVPFAKEKNQPFLIFGHEGSKPVTGHCTATLVSVTAEHIYGVVAEHCVSRDEEFVPDYFTVRGERVELLDYYKPPNEVRIWRIPNRAGLAAGRLVELASGWHPGIRTFVIGYRRHLNEYEPLFTSGYVQSEPGVKLRYYGDLAHSASAISGFSGGGTYVYNESTKRFELLGITVAATTVSNFTFAYSVPSNLWEVIANAGAPTAPPTHLHRPPKENVGRAAFANWNTIPAAVQAAWLAAWQANAQYTLELKDGAWTVIVDGARFGIGPYLKVLQDWANDKLKAKGQLQNVDWSQYEYQI